MFHFDSNTLNGKFSETGERRLALEELFRNGKDVEARLEGTGLEFVSSNYDVYPRHYLKEGPGGWLDRLRPEV